MRAVGAVSDKSNDARIHASSKGCFRVAERVRERKERPELNDRKKIGDQISPSQKKCWCYAVSTIKMLIELPSRLG